MTNLKKPLTILLAGIIFSTAAINLSGCSKRRKPKNQNPVSATIPETELLKDGHSVWKENTKIRAALESNDFGSVKTMALARINSNPEDPQAYYFLGKSQIGMGELLNGTRSFEAAISLQPGNEGYKTAYAQAMDLLAKSAISLGVPSEAVETYEKLLKSGYNQEETEKKLGDAYVKTFESILESGSPNEAESMIRAAAGKYPEQETIKIRLAEHLLDSDRLMEADRILRGLNNTHPNNASAVAAYGKLIHKIGDTEKAKQMLVRALQIDPANDKANNLKAIIEASMPKVSLAQAPEYSMSLEEILENLKLYEKNGNVNNEKRALEILTERFPNETWAVLDLSIVCEKLSEYDSAMKYAEEFLALEPESQKGQLHYAKCLYQKGFFEKGLEIIGELEQSYPNKNELMSEKGQIFARMGNFEGARALWNEVLNNDPDYSETLFNFAQLEMELGNHEQSGAYFEKAIRLEPFNNKYRYFAGLNLIQSGNKNEAHNLWRASIATLNNEDPYAARIVRALGDEGRQEVVSQPQIIESEVIIPAHVINETPADTEAEYSRALGFARAGKFNDAIETFRSLLSHNPSNFNALMNLGKVYTATNRQAQASAIYLKALKLNPQNIHALRALANGYADVGMHSLAYQISNQVKSANPNETEGFPVYNRIIEKNDPRAIEPITKAFLEEGLMSEAMAIVQSTLAQQPENNLMNLLQGDIYKQMGRYDKAAEAYRLAQSREPQTPLPYIRMGDLFAQAKETKNAAAEYTRALNTSFIDPDNMFEIADRFVNIGYNNSASGVWNRLKTMNLNNLQLKKLEVKLGETLSVEQTKIE